VPADDEPQVAMLRVYELGRALASTKFHKWPPAWQQGLAASYQAARQAAQIPDAKLIQGLQQKVQEQQKELTDAKIKLNAASVSIALKGAELDEGQTVAILANEGIRLPPRQTPVAPPATLDPKVELEHKTAMHAATIAAELDKHKTTEATKVQIARIKEAAATNRADNDRAHQAALAKAGPKKHKVIRGKDGKVEGVESE